MNTTRTGVKRSVIARYPLSPLTLILAIRRCKISGPRKERPMPHALHYVSFPSLHPSPLTIAARLRVPSDGHARHPAVLLLHGSAGPSRREDGYAETLNEKG